MLEYKKEFIEFLVEVEALQFGEFTLKSGRISPYFFNSSLFNTGALVDKLGYFYASTIQEVTSESTLIFGPAYKGIPLCVSTAIALSQHFNRDLGYFFNRKEKKSHGDKGILVGRYPNADDKIVMVDDVITDGMTKKESIRLVQQLSPAKFSAIIVAVDRMESNSEGKHTAKAFEEEMNIPVRAIVSIQEICEHLLERPLNGRVYLDRPTYERIDTYLQQFSVRQ